LGEPSDGGPPTDARLHADGTVCMEGSQVVPDGFEACCDRFLNSTTACSVDVRFEWWESHDGWYVIIADGGHSGLHFSFCPFCGSRLAGQHPA
jgi:hypothetical protein